jgi:hypothetical protein
MARREIPPLLLWPAIEAARGQGVKRQVAVTAYLKWQHGADAEGCKYGIEQGVALDCTCVGCIERLCFVYFDQVAAKFNAPLTEYTKGFDD